MTNFTTEQEKFWAGEFGNEYIQRNRDAKIIANNLAFFAKALQHTTEIKSCIEFGANIGLNLIALKQLCPDIQQYAIEINSKAAKQLKDVIGEDNVFEGSILQYQPQKQFDLVLSKGVLIHINPDVLDSVYEKLYSSSQKYILLAEYYNPTPVNIPYRGHTDKLFKRDWAGDLLTKYTDLQLIDYGFVYRRDRFPQDDLHWFLLKKA
ncbi:MAG: pseudaminic acid biosynthesis-associated methylase [Deltaproteobacteria bacterium]|jgi:pseudaminic acid biosynthesis-associated methylase|nr:pseudaminic acid biosynthesis-associated methylase [Deltaproteobacteria bacterium]